VLVLSTTSERALCAGADVAGELDRDGAVARMETFARVYTAVEAFPAPTVCVCVGNVVRRTLGMDEARALASCTARRRPRRPRGSPSIWRARSHRTHPMACGA
jgi:enoyl-CoA hydratase/carnithine racemase